MFKFDSAKLLKVLFLFLLVLLVGCSQTKNDWQKAESENSIQAFEQFIAKHPNHKLVAEAQRKIEELSFAEAEAQNTPKAFYSFIKRFGKSPLVEKARRKIEDYYYQEAANKNTLEAYEDFVRRFSRSERAEQARAKMEPFHFEKAKLENTIVSYKKFLEMYKEGTFAEKAKASIDLLKSSAHPLLKDVRTLGIRVNENYSQAKDVHLSFDSIVKRVALYADLEFIEKNNVEADALIEISVKGYPLRASYIGEDRYAGASFSGHMILKAGRQTVSKRSFSARIEPPKIVFGARGKTPSDAPFSRLLVKKGSFLENFLIMMGQAFGCHVIIPYLNDTDTPTSERVATAIVKAAGKSAYDILVNLSKHEDLHIQQAAITGLGELRDSRALAALEMATKTELGTVVGRQAALALDKMGWIPPNAEARVWHLMAKSEYSVLAAMGRPALEPLVHLLKNGKKPILRQEAARVLRMLNLKDAVPPLIEALEDKSYLVRGEAAVSLGVIGDKAAVIPVIELLSDPAIEVQQHACWALGDLKDARAVKYLIEKLEIIKIRDDAAEALKKITGKDY